MLVKTHLSLNVTILGTVYFMEVCYQSNVVFILCNLYCGMRTAGSKILSPHVLMVETVSGIDFSSLLLLIE